MTASPIDTPASFITLLTRHRADSIVRQTDDGLGRHGDVQIALTLQDQTRWLAVYDNIGAALNTTVPRARRALFVTEPPGIKTYSAGFANQFGTLVSPVEIPGFAGQWLHAQAGLPWFYGLEFRSSSDVVARLNLNDLRAAQCPTDKLARISVVISKKSQLARHRQRLALVDHLQRTFPGRIDVFGNGFQAIPDKAAAIAPYRYHLVLENTDIDHFWTEKTADAFLGFALPLFSGCSNIDDYFPAGSLIQLPDIDNVPAICSVIDTVLRTDPFTAHLDAITAARKLVLESYNLMSVLAQLTTNADGRKANQLSVPFRLRPARDFNGITGWWRSRAPLAS